jgi:predicted DNA-binding transcriptional regulator AlpA
MFGAMSSNLELRRICQHCGKNFIAKKTSTKFCSLPCGQRNYKVRQRMNKIETLNRRAKSTTLLIDKAEGRTLDIEQGLIDIKALAYFTSMSERLIFNLMKDPAFPRLKIGRKVLFEKKTVMDFLVRKYWNWVSSV